MHLCGSPSENTKGRLTDDVCRLQKFAFLSNTAIKGILQSYPGFCGTHLLTRGRHKWNPPNINGKRRDGQFSGNFFSVCSMATSVSKENLRGRYSRSRDSWKALEPSAKERR